MRRALILAALIVLTSTTPAAAAPLGRTVLEGGDPGRRAIYQAIINSGRAPQANVKVKLIERPCPDVEGEPPCVAYDGRWLWYMDPAWAEPQNLAGRFTELSVLHELGHVYDFGGPPDRHRTRFLKALGMAGWLDPLNETWEKFAMGYAYCAAGMSWAEFRRQLPADGAFASKLSTEQGGYWAYGFDYGKRDYQAVCRAIGRRR